jgi:hypothetical protein
MQLETSKALRAMRVNESSAAPPLEPCDTRGCHREPRATETEHVASRKSPLSFSWGDAIVVIGMAILAYLLPVMAWEALFRP